MPRRPNNRRRDPNPLLPPVPPEAPSRVNSSPLETTHTNPPTSKDSPTPASTEPPQTSAITESASEVTTSTDPPPIPESSQPPSPPPPPTTTSNVPPPSTIIASTTNIVTSSTPLTSHLNSILSTHSIPLSVSVPTLNLTSTSFQSFSPTISSYPTTTSESSSSGPSTGVTVGIALGVIAIGVGLIGFFVSKRIKQRRQEQEYTKAFNDNALSPAFEPVYPPTSFSSITSPPPAAATANFNPNSAFAQPTYAESYYAPSPVPQQAYTQRRQMVPSMYAVTPDPSYSQYQHGYALPPPSPSPSPLPPQGYGGGFGGQEPTGHQGQPGYF